jgi:hypothetical protein
MMRRLESDKIIHLNPNNTYKLLDERRLGEILANEDGGMLAQYVFAGHAIESPETSANEAADEAIIADDIAPDSGGDDVVELFKSILAGLKQNHERIDGSLGLLLNNSGEQLALTEKLNEQVTQRERNVGKRIDALEERLTDTQRQIQSMQTTLKATLGTLQWLQQRAQDVGEFTEALRVSSEASVRMNAKLDALIGRLDRAESDRTGKVLHELKVHIEESAALRDMLLETVGERDQ